MCFAIEDFLELSAINHVISHLRYKSLATYDRVRIIRKPDNRECGVILKGRTCAPARNPQSFQEHYESPQNSSRILTITKIILQTRCIRHHLTNFSCSICISFSTFASGPRISMECVCSLVVVWICASMVKILSFWESAVCLSHYHIIGKFDT